MLLLSQILKHFGTAPLPPMKTLLLWNFEYNTNVVSLTIKSGYANISKLFEYFPGITVSLSMCYTKWTNIVQYTSKSKIL